MTRRAALAAPFLLAVPAAAVKRKTRRGDNGPLFGSRTPLPGALHGLVFRLEKGTQYLPDFARLKPVGEVYTHTLDYPHQPYGEEWFAIDYTGAFQIASTGRYRFILTSDDGARLFIDGKRLIDTDGVHAAQSDDATVSLESGPHRIRVAYFQGPQPYVALVLEVEPPRGKKRVFDMRDFALPAAPEARPTLRRN